MKESPPSQGYLNATLPGARPGAEHGAVMFFAPCLLALAPVLAQGPTDAELRAAWGKLPPEELAEVSAWLRAECEGRRTSVRALEQRARYEWPPLGSSSDPDPLIWYDPSVHTPAQVIPRKPLAEGSKELVHELGRLGVSPGRGGEPLWSWPRGVVVAPAAVRAETLLEQALLGRSPEAALLVARLTGLLDGQQQRSTHAAFAHGYATRSGTAFPGITLYDAWSSGEELEMPDVECLGLYHDLFGPSQRFVAPVSPLLQEQLYSALSGRFQSIWRERVTVEALALSFLEADPALPKALAGNADRLHLLWASAAEDPARMKALLPSFEEKAWKAWWKKLDDLRSDEALVERAASRRHALRQDRALVRELLVYVLREWGALGD